MHDIQWEILLGGIGLILSVIYMHFNTTSRIDSQGERIDGIMRDNQALHQEIMELIKKMK